MKPLDTPKDKNGVQKSEDAATTETASEEAPAVNANDPSMPIFDAKKPDFASLVIEPLFEDLVDFETFSKSDFRAVKVKDCVAVPKSKKLLQFTLDDGTGTDRTILSGIHAYYEPEELVGKTCIAITKRYADQRRSQGRRRRKAASTDGRSEHSGRRKAVLIGGQNRLESPV